MGASHLVSLNHLCKFSGGQIVTESLPCNGFSKKASCTTSARLAILDSLQLQMARLIRAMTDPRGVSGETTKGWRSMAASRDRSNSGLFLIGGISVNDKV